MRLLAKTPVERPESAVALRSAIDDILAGLSASAAPRLGALTLSAPLEEPLGALAGTGSMGPKSARSTERRRRRRQRRLALALCGALVALGAGLAVGWSARQSSSSLAESRDAVGPTGPGGPVIVGPARLAAVDDPPLAEAPVPPTDAGLLVHPTDAGRQLGDDGRRSPDTSSEVAKANAGSPAPSPANARAETKLDAVVQRRLPARPSPTPEASTSRVEPAASPSPSAARVPPGLIPVSLEPPK